MQLYFMLFLGIEMAQVENEVASAAQQLLPLTSKPWPWPKVTAVVSISINLLVCAIKWEPLIRSLQNNTTLLPESCLLPDLILEEFCLKLLFWQIFFKNFRCVFSRSNTILVNLGNGWSDSCETKRKCIGWILGMICDLDLWPRSWPWPWMFQGPISK